jgi:hypothetical protein
MSQSGCISCSFNNNLSKSFHAQHVSPSFGVFLGLEPPAFHSEFKEPSNPWVTLHTHHTTVLGDQLDSGNFDDASIHPQEHQCEDSKDWTKTK